MKLKWFLVFFVLLCAIVVLHSQNPQTSDVANTQPLFRGNASWANGVATGYWPTAGAGLTLNVSAGTVFCTGVKHAYAGGTLTMTASMTNYVYLDTTSACAPASNTTGFSSGGTALIPIAEVVTGVSTITTITDDRTPFNASGAVGANPNSITLFDDFMGAVISSALGWGTQGSGGSVTMQGGETPSNLSANIFGWAEVNSGASSGNFEYYILGDAVSTGNNTVNPQLQTFKESWRVWNVNTATSGTVRLGMFGNRGLADPSNGVYFESGQNQSNVDWWCVQENSGTKTSADSAISTASAAIHTVEIDASGTTSAVWKVDGAAVCGGIGTSNFPNQDMNPGAEGVEGSGGAADMRIDYYRMDLTTSGR